MTKKILHLALVLFLVSAIVALALGLVNNLTADRIAALDKEKLDKARNEVLPAADYLPVEYKGGDARINTIHKASDSDGYVVSVTVSGSQGNIGMIVGVGADKKVTGISIIESSETSGMGAIASSSGEDGVRFRSQFVGVENAAVTKDGGQIDAITSATITSRAVCNGVNAAIAAVNSIN